jgi:hypothetical protein
MFLRYLIEKIYLPEIISNITYKFIKNYVKYFGKLSFLNIII